MQARPLLIAGQPLAGGRLPAICAPLVGATRDALAAETAAVAARRPDLLEWRVDFFAAIADADEVMAAADAIAAAAGGIPLLFTRRSHHEGGQPTGLEEEAVLALYERACASRLFALVDYEMARDPAHVRAVRAMAHGAGAGLVLSFHDFQHTPPDEALAARFRQAAELGGDVAKLAVMPTSMDDVLRLLQATLHASRTLEIPVISMAMGGHGALSRLAGGAFGSALTFAVGASASAPGQMPIDEVRAGIDILRRAMG